MIVEAEGVVLLGFLVERDDAAVGMNPESQLLPGGDVRDESARSRRTCRRRTRIERHVPKDEPALGFPEAPRRHSGAAFFSVIQLT